MTLHVAAHTQFEPDRIPHRNCSPIYLQDWWWAIACKDQQKSVAVYEDDREVGRLLYFRRIHTSMGICKLAQAVHAPWTGYCAPTVDDGSANLDTARQGDIAYKLACQLPHNMSYYLTFPHSTPQAVLAAFQRAGFGIDTQKSYVIDLRGATTDDVIAHLDMSTRQRYRKATKKLEIVEIDPSLFFHLYRGDLAARDKVSYHDLQIAESLANGCRARGSGWLRITAAKVMDAPSNDPRSYFAAIACLQDDAFSYYWMSTRNVNATDPDVRNGAVKLLIVDAIAHAARAGRTFDFDGVTTGGSSELYRGFRGTEIDRYILTRKTRPARAIEIVRRIVLAAMARTGLHRKGR